eukprot:2862017-Pyramimonas_sp.AAC.1
MNEHANWVPLATATPRSLGNWQYELQKERTRIIPIIPRHWQQRNGVGSNRDGGDADGNDNCD